MRIHRIHWEMRMSAGDVPGFVNLFGAGMLAGEEFVIRYGVRAPLPVSRRPR
jgi:hypothetical protein